jgi:FixJ family two-component response regulator
VACNAWISEFCFGEIAMTRFQDQKSLTDQSQCAKLRAIRMSLPYGGLHPIMPKIDEGGAGDEDAAPTTASTGKPIVFIVDDDVSVREALASLICSAGWQAEIFESAQVFLHRKRVRVPNCIVLDIALPDFSGLDLQTHLAADRKDMPIIFITAHADIAMAVQAMKAGAFDFLTKPFCNNLLLSAVRRAIERSKAVLDHETEIDGLRDSYMSLSSREREVMALVVSGLSNKQVGNQLGISEITVKVHRGRVMRKMEVGSFAALVRIAGKLRGSPER